MFTALIMWMVIGYTKGVTGGVTSYMRSLASTTLKTYTMSGSFCTNITKSYRIQVTEFTNAIVNFKTEGSKSVTSVNGMMTFTNTFKERTCYPWSYEVSTKLAATFQVTFDGEFLSEYNDLKEQYYGEMTPEPTSTKFPTRSSSPIQTLFPRTLAVKTQTQSMKMTIAPILWTIFFN
jgi:hypothetical protein